MYSTHYRRLIYFVFFFCLQELNRNYGPTVWIENASSTTFNYHQVIDGNNWYMHLSAEGVQGVGSYTRDAQFLKVDCD